MEREQTGRGGKKEEPSRFRWPIQVFFLAIALSGTLSLVSESMLSGAGLVVAVVIVVAFIALGIVFDIIGVAVTAADAKPFHSMAAHREKGAKEALMLLRSASRVSSVCNDVVGDICGIISGATGALIVAHITSGVSAGLKVVVSLLITGLVSALTIGGKAAGKGIAVMCSSKVLALCGRVLSVLPLKLDNRK